MNTESGSSPWNVAPASTSPETTSPWAVSPFQTSNPFKSRDTSSLPAESEPEPDVVSSVMEDLPTQKRPLLPAYSSVKQEETPATSAWTTSPVTRAEETVQKTSWTLDATEQVREVVEKIAVTNFVETTSENVVDTFALPAEQHSVSEVQEEAVLNAFTRDILPHDEKDQTNAWTTSPTLEEDSASAWTVSVEKIAQDPFVEEDAVVKKPAVEALVAKDALEVQVVGRFSPVGEVEEPATAVVEEIGIANMLESKVPAATSDTWTLAPVQHEKGVGAWSLAPVQHESVVLGAVEEQVAVEPVEEKTAPNIAKPIMKIAAIEKKVESTAAQMNTATQVAPSASPWTTVTVQEKVEIAAPVQGNSAQVAKESALVKNISVSGEMEEPIIKEVQSTGVWNPTPVLNVADKVGVVKVVKTIKRVEAVVAEDSAVPVAKSALARLAEDDKGMAALSTWNTTPVQINATPNAEKIKKVVEPLKGVGVETVQEYDSVNQNRMFVKKGTVTQTQNLSNGVFKEVVVAMEADIADVKIDRKAIANAFEGVAGYTADSVVKDKKASCIEATVANSTKASPTCGACGDANCSIM